MMFDREKYLSLCGEMLELAKNMLYSPSLQDLQSATVASSPPMVNMAKNSSSVDKSSPKTRLRSNTIVPYKTTSIDDIGTSSKSKSHRTKNKSGKVVERSQTFLGKEEKKERPHTAHAACNPQVHHRTNSLASGGGPVIDDLPDGGNPSLCLLH